MKKKKQKKCQYSHERYRNLFIENELSQEEKSKKRQHARELYKNLSEEKKAKGPNMPVNYVKIFLKSFNFLLKYNKQGFSW